MKAKDALAGTRAERPIDFLLPNGEKTPVLVRPLTQLEEANAIEYAMAFGKEHGLNEPDYGSALFEIGLRAARVAMATVDPDSPREAREPFFPDAAFVIAHYHPESIIYLHQHLLLWQQQCSPLMHVQTGGELMALLEKVAREDDDEHRFFTGLSPLTQATFARFSAGLAWTSLRAKSSSTSPTEGSATSSPAPSDAS